MVDIEIVKSKGVTVDRLKAMFTAKKGADFDKAEKIRRRIRNRCNKGREQNFANYRYWYACDLAWDVPFRQTTSSLVKGLIDRQLSDKDILSALQGADISDMITVYDRSGKQVTAGFDSKDIKEIKINAPTFFHIYIPLAKAYTTIRAAAIVNSYRQVPLFDYEASKSTKANRMKSEIITDRVELMSTQYGYYDVLKQAVLQMLHYSQCILFPTEEWHCESQLLRKTDGAEPTETVVKEGLRFNTPHPSRVFIDGAYRPSTINSDSGVQFSGYWYITRYAEVAAEKLYWNTDRININSRDLITENPQFFNTVYSSCALKFSVPTDNEKNDREAKLQYYTWDFPDRAVTITNYFEKINPKEEGIADYDYPVWFRYVLAGDDTVIYATPLPFCPMAYFGYDALETRAMNASMTLEILPFQDHISNIFSQYLLTVKQNLANVTFFDTNQVDKKIIDDIRNLGQKTYVAHNFAPMDMRANRMGQNNMAEAFQTFNFAQKDTTGMLQGVNQILGVLERVLVISPQELAQTASHELTAEEVKNMNQAKSTRYEFTAGAVDRGVYALKVMLYNALMAYAEPEMFAKLPMPVDEKVLKELGFTLEDSHDNSALVSGKKSTLWVESFASTRDGDLRANNTQAAQQMVEMLRVITSNPQTFEAVGVEQIVNLVNEISQIAGMPRDFRFTVSPSFNALQTQQMVQQQLQQMIQQIQQSTVQASVQAVATQLKPVFETQAQKFEEVEGQINHIEDQINKLAEMVLPPPPQPMAAPPMMPPPVSPYDPANASPPVGDPALSNPQMVAGPGVPIA